MMMMHSGIKGGIASCPDLTCHLTKKLSLVWVQEFEFEWQWVSLLQSKMLDSRDQLLGVPGVTCLVLLIRKKREL